MPTASDSPVRYDQDLYAWFINNAKRLRQGHLDEIDATQIAEEFWPT
jgi:hypothetical protein